MSISRQHWLPDELEVTWIDEPHDQQANILLDDELAGDVAHGRRTAMLRLWSGGRETAIAVSRRDIQQPAGRTAAQQLRREGCSVFVRGTGGTAVPLGPGVLHASLLLPRSPRRVTTDDYYRLLCGVITDWLSEYGLSATVGALPGSYCDGSYNVLVGGKKLVGTAQAWRGGLAGMASARPGYVVAHACITVDVDLSVGGAWINRFYQLAGQPEIDMGAAITLRDLVPDLFRGATGALRRRAALDLARSAAGFFAGLGVVCREDVKPTL